MMAPFTEAGLVIQLTQWRGQIEQHLTEQATSYSGTKSAVEKISEDNVRLDQRLDGVQATASARLDDIVARGIQTLQATIAEFNTQIGQDRYAMQAIHDGNRHSLELVVAQAAEKFKELDEIQGKAKGEMRMMVESFNTEVERGRAADVLLHGEIQELFRLTHVKFDSLDGWIGAQDHPGG